MVYGDLHLYVVKSYIKFIIFVLCLKWRYVKNGFEN